MFPNVYDKNPLSDIPILNGNIQITIKLEYMYNILNSSQWREGNGVVHILS